jgi:hypothetical protein
MKTKEIRRQQNVKYVRRKAEQGIVITSFLMPMALRDEVKAFIKARSQELAAKR